MNLKSYILMIKIIYFLLVVFLCTGFAYREPSYCKIVDCITKSYLQEFANPRHLMLSGYGGAMMHDIQEISLSFLSHDTLNVDEARILYVEMVEELLQRVNSHEQIRPHLHNFPFGIDNIKLDISFINSEGATTKNGRVAFMYIGKNQDLLYRACNPDTEEFYSLHREPYAEARRIVTGK
ncbi:MAG: hypothetical protein ACKVOH_03840 [Chlamydiales bacterium]